MEVRINLLGALKPKAPPGDRISVPDGATIDDVLATLDLVAPQIQIVMLNGRPQPDRSKTLEPDDELTVLPPVGGG